MRDIQRSAEIIYTMDNTRNDNMQCTIQYCEKKRDGLDRKQIATTTN